MNTNELHEFETELKKLTPARFPHHADTPRAVDKRTISSFLIPLSTLCAGLLIGAVLGASVVYFSLGTTTQQTAVQGDVKEKIPVEPEPQDEELPKQITPRYICKTPEPDPFDLNAMILQDQNRRKVLQEIAATRSSFSSSSLRDFRSITDPNSLLQLRASQEFTN